MIQRQGQLSILQNQNDDQIKHNRYSLHVHCMCLNFSKVRVQALYIAGRRNLILRYSEKWHFQRNSKYGK